MYKHILVPVAPEHGEVGARIVALAKLLAGGSGRITLLTVMDQLPGYIADEIPVVLIESNRTAAVEQLRELARQTGIDRAAVELREGRPAATILDEAGRLGVDAIILGSHRPDFTDYLLGSTAARVVRHAQCTVIVERSAPVSA